MCGRFTLHHSVEEVADRFKAQQVLFEFPERYNIAPNQPLAVITQNAYGDGVRALEGYRWGLVPSWAKDDAIGSKMIHARVETLTEKPSYKTALQRRRCLIPADGFYEWKGTAKQPMHIRFRDGRLFAFAGLWDEWYGPGDSPLRTCTLITCPPNNLLSTLHHRMAVMLEPEQEDIWLNPRLSMQEALQLLNVYPDDELEAFPVGKRVGNVAFDDATCVAPLAAGIQPGEQLSLL